jgi:miniconductance mechanosensitive channel
MSRFWNFFFGIFSSSGLSTVWSEIGAGVFCMMAVVLTDLAVCVAIDVFVRRLIVRKTDGSRHREKAMRFAVAARRFVFVWILGEWLPECLKADLEVLRPACAVLSVAAVALCAVMFSAAISWLQSVAHVRTGDKTFSSKTFAQVAKIVVWSMAVIIIAATLMGKSPAFVLSGLGALTAVLMLIFRDPILGLVAGVQAGQNDMVRLGDWITMQKYSADGTVIDIALTTIKVRNFDNTVTMIPSSALLSDAFVNWRYMSTSKGRRIKRPVWISVTSIRELDDASRAELVGKGLMEKDDRPVSNLAAFETWLSRMLKADPAISDELTCMVRQTEAGDTGIPVEVYCFTKTRDWEEYEAIQTEIFDRIFVTVPKFGLCVYQRTGDRK